MKYQLYVAALVLCLANQTSFGALVITEVVPTPGAPAGTLENLDWFEITNTGPSSALLDGYHWIDNPLDNGDSASFPSGVSVASGESIIIHRDTIGGMTQTGVAEAFRTDWGLDSSVQVLTESQFGGDNTFSGLGGAGDALYLFDGPTPGFGNGALVSNATFGVTAPGVSFEWGTNGTGPNGTGLGRQSMLGQNGAFSASNGRVGSPGVATAINYSDPTIFKDTFELSTFSASPLEPDLNAELPNPRQTFATSGYTQAGGAAIEDDPFGPGSGGWLTLTATNDTIPGAGNSVGVANLKTNFAPAVAGKKYSVSYTSRMDIPSGSTVDFWQGFGLGDNTPEGLFPNNPETDFGILFRRNGDFSVFLDGDFKLNGSGTGIVPGENFDVEFVFDETESSPTVSGTVTTATGTVNLGTLALDSLGATGFENLGRFFELRTFVFGPNVTPGDLYTNRFDNFTIAEFSLTADFNGDELVNGDDLLIWQSGYGTGVSLAEGDADADGDVDGQDFLLWQRNVTASPLATSTGVPEPTSCVLTMIALGAGIGLRRKR